MKIGILSDTHDHMDNIEQFVERFNSEKVDAVFHCGDFVSPFVARKFKNLAKDIAFYAIRGNNDGDITHLNWTFKDIGPIKENHQKIDLSGKKILMLHGHAIAEQEIQDIAKTGRYDIVMYGHYHHIRNEMIGNTLLVNPGEGCGYLTGKATCMIVKTKDERDYEVEVIEI